MTRKVIQLTHLKKIFHRDSVEICALNDVSLIIGEGEFVSLMGPSGSGKTTLLNIIAGIDQPSSGEVRVGCEDLTRLSEDKLAGWRNSHVGFVFQHFNLLPVLTAFENIELPLLLTSLDRKERREHVQASLEIVGLADRADHYPRQLSGGQEQRVAIARALVTDPAFILADEPTGDLDAQSAEDVLQVLHALNQDWKKTIVMVTHDPRAARYASVNYLLDKGVLVERLEAAI